MEDNELKIAALMERMAGLVAGYENMLADYRVEITKLSEQLAEAHEQLNAPVDVQEEKPTKAK